MKITKITRERCVEGKQLIFLVASRVAKYKVFKRVVEPAKAFL